MELNGILMTFTLTAALAVFSYSIGTKLRLFWRTDPENRFEHPLRRLGRLFRTERAPSQLAR